MEEETKPELTPEQKEAVEDIEAELREYWDFVKTGIQQVLFTTVDDSMKVFHDLVDKAIDKHGEITMSELGEKIKKYAVLMSPDEEKAKDISDKVDEVIKTHIKEHGDNKIKDNAKDVHEAIDGIGEVAKSVVERPGEAIRAIEGVAKTIFDGIPSFVRNAVGLQYENEPEDPREESVNPTHPKTMEPGDEDI